MDVGWFYSDANNDETVITMDLESKTELKYDLEFTKPISVDFDSDGQWQPPEL